MQKKVPNAEKYNFPIVGWKKFSELKNENTGVVTPFVLSVAVQHLFTYVEFDSPVSGLSGNRLVIWKKSLSFSFRYSAFLRHVL